MVVEDGTGLANADAFVTSLDVETYLTARGFTAFAALPTATKNAAIVNASEYISNAFGWIGLPLKSTQALAWPRGSTRSDGVRVPTGVPRAVAIATARVANAAAAGAELFGTVTGADTLKRVKAGSVEVEFSDLSAQIAAAGRASMPWLAELLGALITSTPDSPTNNGGMSSIFVERA